MFVGVALAELGAFIPAMAAGMSKVSG